MIPIPFYVCIVYNIGNNKRDNDRESLVLRIIGSSIDTISGERNNGRR